MARRDAERLVGRARELELFGRLFVEDPPASVVIVHGAGGVGKSALLREVARRGEAAGWTPHWIEGRNMAPEPEALERALLGVRDVARPLVLIDTYERLAPLDAHLRDDLLPTLPERAVVVVAGRNAPAPGWLDGAWSALVRVVGLEPLADEEAAQLLAEHGIADTEAALAMTRWAEGSPLALTLLAATGVPPERLDATSEPVRELIRRLVEAEVEPQRRDLLAVAALARIVTPDLLAAVAPEEDAQAGYAWLASRTFSEPVGRGLALHALVRRALRAQLRETAPERERELRRRVADFLHERAAAGDLMLSIDLADLAESKLMRSGYSWEVGTRFRVDRPRLSDMQEVAAMHAQAGRREWWRPTARWFEEAPDRVTVLRDATGALAGYGIDVTIANAPAFAADDPVLGRWLAHARAHHPPEQVVLHREHWDFTGDRPSRVTPMLGMNCILRSGLINPRFTYLAMDPAERGHMAFSVAAGGRRIDGLDVRVGGVLFECHVVDWGPGGVFGAQRDLVYRELGLEPPVTAGPAVSATITFDDVRDALRGFHNPAALAQSPLAEGRGAEHARTTLVDAVARAFGDRAEEQLNRRVLELGYIDASSTHEAAAHALSLSRAAYFRRLKQATERVAQFLGAQ